VSLQTVAAHPDAQKGGTAKKKFGDNCVSSQTVAAHPDAQKGGTAKKQFGDNCVSSQTVAAHPDAQRGGTADKKFGDNCESSQAVFNSLSLAAPPMDWLGSYPEASGLAPRITPTGMRNLNEEAVARVVATPSSPTIRASMKSCRKEWWQLHRHP
jgi:hypothetical protein